MWRDARHLLTLDDGVPLVSVFLNADRFEQERTSLYRRVVFLSLCGVMSGIGLALVVLRLKRS